MKTKLAMLLLFALAFHPALLLAEDKAPAAPAAITDADADALDLDALDEDAALEDEELLADEELALDEDLTDVDETAEAVLPAE